jgi:copper chaperone CopZ
MRTIAAALALATMSVLSAVAQQQTDKPVILKVSGMSCSACAKTVEKEAKKIDGVKAAKVSQPKGEAEITYDPAKTSPEAIAKRISDKTPFKAEAPKKTQ